MEKESSCRRNASSREILLITSWKDLLLCKIKMGKTIQASGNKIKSTERESIVGRMEADTTESINSGKEKDLELCIILMEKFTKALGLMELSKAKVPIRL